MGQVPSLKGFIALCAGIVGAGLIFHLSVRRPAPAAGAATAAVARAPSSAAAPDIGVWEAEPRRVPQATATLADFDAAFAFGRFGSRALPLRAQLTTGQLVELNAQGAWRRLGRMTEFVDCANGLFARDAQRRWFAWRNGAAAVPLPAEVVMVHACTDDVATGMVHPSPQQAPQARWYRLDGQQVATQPAPAPPAVPAATASSALSLQQDRHVNGLVDAAGRWLTPKAPASAFELWSLTPALRDEAARLWAQNAHMIDRQGQPVRHLSVPPEGARFVDGLWVVALSADHLRLAAADGRWLTGPTQGFAGLPPSEGLAAAQAPSSRLWGYLGRDGQWAIPPRFSEAQSFEGGIALVSAPDAAGQPQPFLIDRQGARVAVPPTASDLDLVEGLERIGVNGRWGYVDADGRSVIAPRFAQAQAFSQGLAAVQVEGRWGYIDKRGTLAIAPAFDEAGPFAEGIAWVRRDGSAQLIDRQGQAIPIVDPVASDVRPLVEGRAAAQGSDGAWGVVDAKGRWIVAPAYQSVGDFENGFALVLPPRVGPAVCLTSVAAVLANGMALLQRCSAHALMDPQGRLLVPQAKP